MAHLILITNFLRSIIA